MVIECQKCKTRQELIEQPLIKKNGAPIGAVSYCGECCRQTVHRLIRTARGQTLSKTGVIREQLVEQTIDYA